MYNLHGSIHEETMLKQQILDLHNAGKSYREIEKLLGCSRGTISYYLNPNTKIQTVVRTRKYREKHGKLSRKLSTFLYASRSKGRAVSTERARKILKNRMENFFRNKKTREHGVQMFTLEDVIKKCGEKPVCYLTGEQLDFNNPVDISFDHIIPVSKGGANTLDNLGICTKQVNQSKTDMTPDEYLNLCKKVLEHAGYTVTG